MKQDDSTLKKAKQYALRLLTDMDRTESQLREKLKQKEYLAETIEKVISYVKSFGYIDDERYAIRYVERSKFQKSKRQIFAELTKKGIGREELEVAFCEWDEEDERKAVQAILQKRQYHLETADRKERERCYRYLASKGFSFEVIRKALESISK